MVHFGKGHGLVIFFELCSNKNCDSVLHYPSSLSTLVGFDLLNCTTFCIDQLMEKTMASRDNTVL